jgi:hypothetical protein
MVTESFQSALGLLRTPPAWLPGIAAGSFAASFILIQYSFGVFLAERLLVLELVIFPFFGSGLLHLVKTGERSFVSFISGARSGYFRVLLPSLVVFFALILTIVLLLLPLAIAGLAETALVFVVISASTSVLLFTFFSDAAAVIEDRKVFDSIRRSVEFVLQQTRACMVFYLISLAILFAVSIAAMVAWTAVLYDRLEPLAAMSAEELQSFTPAAFNELLGSDGIVISALLAFIGVTIAISLILGFRACFFRDCAGAEVSVAVQGEYDEKGRWYKY